MKSFKLWPTIGLPLLLMAGMLAWLGSYPLFQPDEGRNAEVAREMLASGDYVEPRLNDVIYVDKPVLHFAVAAMAMKLFGVNEFAARLPSVVFTTLTALVIGWFGRRLWNWEVGWMAAVLLLSSPLTFVMARVVILDSLLALLLVLSLVSFYLAVEGLAFERGDVPARLSSVVAWRRWSIAAWIAIGLGVLTKGPVALLVPLLVAIPFAVARRSVPAVFYWPAVLLGVAIVVPWVVLMDERLPHYLNYVLVTETWRRISTDDLHRSEPFWFFVPIMLVGTFPWILMLVASAWRYRHKRPRLADPRIQYLVLWVALPFLFFSLSRSKLPHYMLPLIPAVALLTAAGIAGGEFRLPAGRAVVAVVMCALGTLMVGAAFVPGLLAHLEHSLLEPAREMFLAVGVTALLAGAIGLIARPRGPWLAATFSLPIVIVALGGHPFIAAAAQTRSANRLAESIEQRLPGEREVVGINAYPTALPFYLASPIVVSSAQGKELTSNYVLANYAQLVQAHDSPLRGPDWWKTALRECREPTAFVVGVDDSDITQELIAAGLPLIATDRKYTVYGPCRSATVTTTARLP